VLTNRMSELLTYGSVGGGGSNPAPYPAANRAMTLQLTIDDQWRPVADLGRYVLAVISRPSCLSQPIAKSDQSRPVSKFMVSRTVILHPPFRR
jgi:hypothetical protein